MNEDLLDQLKLSLRLSDDEAAEDSTILSRNLVAAENYVKGAVGTELTDFYDREDVQTLYEIVVISIASAYYTYRSASMTGRVNNVNLTSNSIIAQLRGKYAKAMEEVDADGSEHKS